MKYKIFEDEIKAAEANGRWLYAMYKDGKQMKDREKRKEPKKNAAWDFGKKLKDGRVACLIPDEYADEFGGIEEELEKGKFKEAKK